jgi:Ser/Thr protein kinase RdoA (MazF antagonist)
LEEKIRSRFNENILAETQRRYGIDPAKTDEPRGFESFIYGYEKGGKRYVLRLGHSLRRSPNLIRGEVDWINHLAAGGAGVAKAIDSEAGNLVELIDDGQGEQFLATAFVWAEGGSVWQMEGWTERFMLNYGRLIGKIHSLTKQYKLPNNDWKRPPWDDPLMTDATNALPQLDPAAMKLVTANLTHLRQLPTTPDSSGMIHQDAHLGNLFVDANGRITLFDFDDCVYGHFINDIAIVLFYAIANRPDPIPFCAELWPLFWCGYCEENRLDTIWLKEIPHFMKLREYQLYGIIRRDIPDYEGDEWFANFMRGRQENILAERPTIDFDFTKVTSNEN